MKQIGAILIVLTLVTVFTAGGQSGDRQEQQAPAVSARLKSLAQGLTVRAVVTPRAPQE